MKKAVSLFVCTVFITYISAVYGQSQSNMQDITRQLQSLDAQVTQLYDQIYDQEIEIALSKSQYNQRLKSLKDDDKIYTGWDEDKQEPSLAPDEPINVNNSQDYIEMIVLAMRRHYKRLPASRNDVSAQQMFNDLMKNNSTNLVHAIWNELLETDKKIREKEAYQLVHEYEQIRTLETNLQKTKTQLEHLKEHQELKFEQSEKMVGEVINISGIWITDKGEERIISGSGGGYLLRGTNENLVKGLNPNKTKKAYAHKGTIYYTQVGKKNTLEGNLYDIAGYCCGNQGVVEITVINEKRLDVVSRWWKKGVPEKEAKQVHTFVETWKR